METTSSPAILSSSSSPDLTLLELRRPSLTRSTDSSPSLVALQVSNVRIEERLKRSHSHTTSVVVSSSSSSILSDPKLTLSSSNPPTPGSNSSDGETASAPASLQNSPRRRKRDSLPPLSATPDVVDRPKTLPPKQKSELHKHMKEYEEISKHIKKALDKEAKDKVKKDAHRAVREKKLIEYRKVWVEEILPHWNQNYMCEKLNIDHKRIKDSKKAIEMWRFGLPPSVRGQVWKLSVGNELFITKDLFDISVGHAQQTKASMLGTTPPKRPSPEPGFKPLPRSASSSSIDSSSAPAPDELLGKEGTVALVSMSDLPAQFPARQLFQPGGPMAEQFQEVLEAYVAYRPDVGFVPCMTYIVACFLLNMDTLDSFICLANFINKPFNLAFYITNRSQIFKYTQTADSILYTLLPKIHKHFQEVGIEPENYLIDWFMTVFLKALPLDIASRVWDLYFLEGEICLFKVSLALLSMHSHQFETYPKDLCLGLLNHFPDDLDGEDLFDLVDKFNLDPKKFAKLIGLDS